MAKGKKIEAQKDEEEFFDDCPICQAMKTGKNSPEGLAEAFEKAKKQGAVVGGMLIDNKK